MAYFKFPTIEELKSMDSAKRGQFFEAITNPTHASYLKKFAETGDWGELAYQLPILYREIQRQEDKAKEYAQRVKEYQTAGYTTGAVPQWFSEAKSWLESAKTLQQKLPEWARGERIPTIEELVGQMTPVNPYGQGGVVYEKEKQTQPQVQTATQSSQNYSYWKSPQGTIFQAPIGSETEANFKKLGYTPATAEEEQAQKMKVQTAIMPQTSQISQVNVPLYQILDISSMAKYQPNQYQRLPTGEVILKPGVEPIPGTVKTFTGTLPANYNPGLIQVPNIAALGGYNEKDLIRVKQPDGTDKIYLKAGVPVKWDSGKVKIDISNINMNEIPSDIFNAAQSEKITTEPPSLWDLAKLEAAKLIPITVPDLSSLPDIYEGKTIEETEKKWWEKFLEWTGLYQKAEEKLPEQLAPYTAKITELENKLQRLSDQMNQVNAEYIAREQAWNTAYANIRNQPISLSQIQGQLAYAQNMASIELNAINGKKLALAAEYNNTLGFLERADSLKAQAENAIRTSTANFIEMKAQELSAVKGYINEIKTSMKAEEQRRFELALSLYQAQINQQIQEASKVEELMLQYPFAGILPTDDLVDALDKIAPYVMTEYMTRIQSEIGKESMLSPSAIATIFSQAESPQDAMLAIQNMLSMGITLPPGVSLPEYGFYGQSYVPSGVYTPSQTGTRADRNNNPGNIKYGEFAKSAGAIGYDDKGFAIFPDVETGFDAMIKLLSGPSYANLTLSQAIAKYAPREDGNDPRAYVKAVVADTGFSPDAKIKDLDIRKLVLAMAKHEGFTGNKVQIAEQPLLSTTYPTRTAGEINKQIEKLNKLYDKAFISEYHSKFGDEGLFNEDNLKREYQTFLQRKQELERKQKLLSQAWIPGQISAITIFVSRLEAFKESWQEVCNTSLFNKDLETYIKKANEGDTWYKKLLKLLFPALQGLEGLRDLTIAGVFSYAKSHPRFEGMLRKLAGPGYKFDASIPYVGGIGYRGKGADTIASSFASTRTSAKDALAVILMPPGTKNVSTYLGEADTLLPDLGSSRAEAKRIFLNLERRLNESIKTLEFSTGMKLGTWQDIAREIKAGKNPFEEILKYYQAPTIITTPINE